MARPEDAVLYVVRHAGLSFQPTKATEVKLDMIDTLATVPPPCET